MDLRAILRGLFWASVSQRRQRVHDHSNSSYVMRSADISETRHLVTFLSFPFS